MSNADIAWDNFLAQFDSSPRLESLVRALYAGDTEQAVRELLTERWLDTAEGQQLDGIGQIVDRPRRLDHSVPVKFFGFREQTNTTGFGQARIRRTGEQVYANSATLRDPEYRKVLAWKIAVNNGSGTAPEIIAAMRLIFDAQFVRIQNIGNAKFNIWLSQLPNSSSPLMADIVKWVPKAAGVGLNVITGSSEQPFGFAEQGFYGFGVGTMARRIA